MYALNQFEANTSPSVGCEVLGRFQAYEKRHSASASVIFRQDYLGVRLLAKKRSFQLLFGSFDAPILQDRSVHGSET